MDLINWLWLEDLLVRACELEIREFGLEHREEEFFALCLEFEGLTGSLDLSYGTRESVERAASERVCDPDQGCTCYRTLELRPEHWAYRRLAIADPEGVWKRAQAILDRYRNAMGEDGEPDVAEFSGLGSSTSPSAWRGGWGSGTPSATSAAKESSSPTPSTSMRATRSWKTDSPSSTPAIVERQWKC